MTQRVQWFALTLLLIASFLTVNIANAEDGKDDSAAGGFRSGTFIGGLDKDQQEEFKKLQLQSQNKTYVQEMDVNVGQMQRFLMDRNSRLNNPNEFIKLAAENGIGGVAIDELMKNDAAVAFLPETMATTLTSTIPQLRLGMDSNSCNPRFWPTGYFCGGCQQYLKVAGVRTNFCLHYAFTPSTSGMWPTEINSVSVDSSASTHGLDLVDQISAEFKSGEMFGEIQIPGASETIRKALNQAIGLIKTVDWKKVCIDRSLVHKISEIAMQTAMSGGKMPQLTFDAVGEVEACLKNAVISTGVIPTGKDFKRAQSLGDLTEDSAKMLQRGLMNQKAMGITSETTFSYLKKPAVASRLSQKQLQDAETSYPNFRVHIFPNLQFYLEWVMDPSVAHYVKPPYEPMPEVNPSLLFALDGDTSPDVFAENSKGKTMLAMMREFGVLSDAMPVLGNHGDGYLAVSYPPTQTEKTHARYNPFKHAPATPNFFPFIEPLRKLPRSENLLESPTLTAMDPRYLKQTWQQIQQMKNPYGCSSMERAAQWNQLQGYNTQPIQQALKVADALAKVKQFGPAAPGFINKASDGVRKILDEYRISRGSFTEMCSTVTGATLGTRAGKVVSAQRMGAVSKVFKAEFDQIEKAGRAMVTIRKPKTTNAATGGISNLPVSVTPSLTTVTTNEIFYEYLDGRDKIQYFGTDLKDLGAPFPLPYSNQCRSADINDQTAQGESMVFPFQKDKVYVTNTFMNVCPAYEPIGKTGKNTTFNGIPIAQIIDKVLLVITGGKSGLQNGKNRWH